MNQVVLLGRLTAEPEVRYNGETPSVTKYRLAVDRYRAREGDAKADYFQCVCFGNVAKFAAEYLHKGMKVAIVGRLQSGSYENNEGRKVYTVDVIVEKHEFCERRREEAPRPAYGYQNTQQQPPAFTEVEDDGELPF